MPRVSNPQPHGKPTDTKPNAGDDKPFYVALDGAFVEGFDTAQQAQTDRQRRSDAAIQYGVAGVYTVNTNP